MLAKVPACQLAETAASSRRDGDVLCSAIATCASVRHRDADEGVYRALQTSGLVLPVVMSYVNIGPGKDLQRFPVFSPRSMLDALVKKNRFSKMLGSDLKSSALLGT